MSAAELSTKTFVDIKHLKLSRMYGSARAKTFSMLNAVFDFANRKADK